MFRKLNQITLLLLHFVGNFPHEKRDSIISPRNFGFGHRMLIDCAIVGKVGLELSNLGNLTFCKSKLAPKSTSIGLLMLSFSKILLILAY